MCGFYFHKKLLLITAEFLTSNRNECREGEEGERRGRGSRETQEFLETRLENSITGLLPTFLRHKWRKNGT